MPDVPSFRSSMESSGARFLEGSFEGEVLSGKRKEERYVFEVRPSKETGTVFVYLNVSEEEAAMLTGARGSFQGRYFLFQKATNFGEFDVRSYYDALGVRGGFLAEKYSICPGRKRYLPELAFRLREYVRGAVERYGGARQGVYLSALLSDRTELPEETGTALKATGLMYLLSSSGFLFSFFGIAVLNFFKKRMKNRFLPAALAGLFMLIPGILTGFSFSFLRAMTVFLVRAAAPLFKRKFDVLSAFSLSLLILVLTRPEAVGLAAFRYSVALMLSSGAISDVIAAYFFKSSKRESAAVRLLSMKCAFLPLTVTETFRPGLYAFFGEAVMTFIRAVVTVLSGTGILGDALFGRGNLFSKAVFSGADLFAGCYEDFPKLLNRLPLQNIVNGRPSFVRIMIYLILFSLIPVVLKVLLIHRKYAKESEERLPGKGARAVVLASLFAVFLFGILFLRHDPLSREETRLTMADVGQGDGFLLETEDAVVVIDGGSTDREDVGDVLSNTLFYYGRSRIDAVFLSHDDEDHTSGVVSILRSGRFSVGRIYLPDTKNKKSEFTAVRKAAEEAGIPVRYLSAGDKITLDRLTFEVLWPGPSAAESGNDTSMVLSVRCPETSVLFTGDISASSEAAIGSVKAHDYLKVPHHGSAYSSSAAFLKRVSPRIALVSYGKYNTYGHPASETLARLEEAKSMAFLSGRDGAVSFRIAPDGENVTFASR